MEILFKVIELLGYIVLAAGILITGNAIYKHFERWLKK